MLFLIFCFESVFLTQRQINSDAISRKLWMLKSFKHAKQRDTKKRRSKGWHTYDHRGGGGQTFILETSPLLSLPDIKRGRKSHVSGFIKRMCRRRSCRSRELRNQLIIMSDSTPLNHRGKIVRGGESMFHVSFLIK